MNMPVNSNVQGSSLYYSTLHCSPEQREKIRALRHIYLKLSKIKPIAVTWWQSELAQKHPELIPVLHAFLKDAETSLYEEEGALHEFYRNTAGLFERYLGKLLYGITNKAVLDNLEAMGIFIAKINHFRQIKTQLEQGKLYISGEALIKHRVNLYNLSQLTLTEPVRLLFEEEYRHIQHYFKKNLPKQARPTNILAYIQRALLEEIKQSGFLILTHRVSLTPLRKWWIALRH